MHTHQMTDGVQLSQCRSAKRMWGHSETMGIRAKCGASCYKAGGGRGTRKMIPSAKTGKETEGKK